MEMNDATSMGLVTKRVFEPGEAIAEIEAVASFVHPRRDVPRYRPPNLALKEASNGLLGHRPLPESYRKEMRLIAVPVPCLPGGKLYGRCYRELNHISKYVQLLMHRHPDLRAMMDFGVTKNEEVSARLIRYASMMPIALAERLPDCPQKALLNDEQLNRACAYTLDGAVELEQCVSGRPWGVACFAPPVRASIGPDPETGLYNAYGLVHVEAIGDDPATMEYKRMVLTLYADGVSGIAEGTPLRIAIGNACNARPHLSMLVRHASPSVMKARFSTWRDCTQTFEYNLAFLVGSAQRLKGNIERRAAKSGHFSEATKASFAEIGAVSQTLAARHGSAAVTVSQTQTHPEHLIAAMELFVGLMFHVTHRFPERAEAIRNYVAAFQHVFCLLAFHYTDAICARFMSLPVQLERTKLLLNRIVRTHHANGDGKPEVQEPQAENWARSCIREPLTEAETLSIISRKHLPPNVRALLGSYLLVGKHEEANAVGAGRDSSSDAEDST